MKDLFISSYRELKNVRCITLTAMFGAISIILGSLTIMVGDFLKIGFSFLPNEFVFYLFGPFVGAIYGAFMDILTFIVKPTGTFFPGFTVSAILTGLIYGTIMYKRPLNIKRVIVANLIRIVFIDILLNTYWLTILIGKGFFVLLPIRALKGLIMLIGKLTICSFSS
jgi:ECF transporter S component (folate family)